MSNTKLVVTLVLALVLGFGGGYLAQMVGGSSDVADLSDKVDVISNRVGSLQTKVGKMPDDLASFATVDEVSALKSSISNLEQEVENTGVGVSGADVTELKNKVQDLESQVNEIETTGRSGSAGLEIGYVNAQEAFTVFTDAVKEKREKVLQKSKEIRELQSNPDQVEDSELEYTRLQAEKLRARLQINLAMIKKMKSAKGFQSISDELTNFEGQVQPIVDELDKVLESLEGGSAIPEEVNQTLNQVYSMYQQVDSQLTSLIESKIFQIVNVQAVEEGYDLVFRQENVMLYPNQKNTNDKIDDLTSMMKEALRDELSA